MPEQVPEESPGMHDGKKYNHPAFGQVRFSRIQGGTTLYGTEFRHNDFISLTISRSEMERGLSYDWYYGHQDIIEVWMSEAQFATLISTMNHGSGVPCTIKHVQGERMPEIPLRNVVSQFQKEVRETLKDVVSFMKKSLDAVKSELGMGLSQSRRNAITHGLERAIQEVESNLPFVEKSFGQHIEQTTAKAKIEVEAFITNAITRAGVEAITQGRSPLLLGGGDDKESRNSGNPSESDQ